MHPAESRRRGQPEMPLGSARGAGGHLLRLVEIGEYPADAGEIARSRLGEAEAPRGAVEKPHAQALFEGGDGAGHGRRRKMQEPGGPSEAARLHHGGEELHAA